MSTRNPMNKRYTVEDEKPKGTAKKSAASAKPKAKAAYSVHEQNTKMTPREKRQVQKQKERQERAERQERLSMLGAIDNPKYKFYRRIWWIMLILAIVFIALSWIIASRTSWNWVAYTSMGLAYVCLIGGIVLDVWKVRPFRKEQERLAAQPLSKKQRKEFEAQKAAKEAAAEQKRQNSVSGRIFNRKKAGQVEEQISAEKEKLEGDGEGAKERK